MDWEECEKKWLYAKNINLRVRGVVKLIEFFLKRVKKSEQIILIEVGEGIVSRHFIT